MPKGLCCRMNNLTTFFYHLCFDFSKPFLSTSKGLRQNSIHVRDRIQCHGSSQKCVRFFLINMFFEPKIITKCLSLHIRSHIFCNLKPRSGQVAEMKEKHMRFVSSGLPNKDHMPIFFNYLIEIINRHETATSCCIYLEIWFWPLKHIAELACETKHKNKYTMFIKIKLAAKKALYAKW